METRMLVATNILQVMTILIMRSPRVRMKRRLMRRHLRCEYLIRRMSNCFVQILCYHLTCAKL